MKKTLILILFFISLYSFNLQSIDLMTNLGNLRRSLNELIKELTPKKLVGKKERNLTEYIKKIKKFNSNFIKMLELKLKLKQPMHESELQPFLKEYRNIIKGLTKEEETEINNNLKEQEEKIENLMNNLHKEQLLVEEKPTKEETK
jgi:exonuclease VII large subunit